MKLNEHILWLVPAVVCFLCAGGLGAAQRDAAMPGLGPYNGVFVADGLGIIKPIDTEQFSPKAGRPWSMIGWFKRDRSPLTNSLLAGIGESTKNCTYLGISNGKVAAWVGSKWISSQTAWTPGTWHFGTVTFDGTTLRLYSDGEQVADKAIATAAMAPVMEMAPEKLPWADGQHFAGHIADYSVIPRAVTAGEVREMFRKPPNFALLEFQSGSAHWPVQTRAQAGESIPQAPATLPQSPVPFSKAVAQPVVDAKSLLSPRGKDEWALQGGWKLAEAPKVRASGNEISEPGFQTDGWYAATVPGTVLTTLINRGVYPDPDYGLNNLAIPESLNKQDYWYRAEFSPAATMSGRRLTLTFKGINYAAVIWVNGHRLGEMQGAFKRGIFDVTGIVKPGKINALAVRISPPPHPGIPSEQSVKFGPGDNGGMLCLDGPTFVATEGWDWIPGIRDRNTGIWQEVTLTSTGPVQIGDPQVVTNLPLPQTSSADVRIVVPLNNTAEQSSTGELNASFEGVHISKRVTLAPGQTTVALDPAEFPELHVRSPRLWWPNGYGKPELYHLLLSFTGAQGESDTKTLRFGIREISYELTLLDKTGHLQRMEYSPTKAMGHNLVDVSHKGTVKTVEGWVPTLRPEGEHSTAIHPSDDTKTAPYLVIKVNGVRIACRGGNWGMDDSRKRISRAHLEPYFRLHRDAHLNIIRNWVGQNTEDVFYDLADEYGLLVWNDFWDSTQNYNLEPDDSSLFLANARDTLLRYRNHPSIVIWCGRNEGMPSPAINKGLDELISELDGTRYYSPSSNQVNLHNSGPYRYQDPASFFTTLSRGFAVELGIPSMPTIDAFRAAVPQEEQWPPNDTWAYHDWHQSGNGDVAPFMAAMTEEFGAPTSLEDFERKAQLLNYVGHRAIFEGFNAHLWNPNSGRMLWMTHPAWPSTMWQIYSSDYDTQASFYGVKKASEPIHVQMNLPDFKAAVVNNTTAPLNNVALRTRVYLLDGALASSKEQKLNAPASAETEAYDVTVPRDTVAFVKLELLDEHGTLLSSNFYWQASQPTDYRKLDDLAAEDVSGLARVVQAGIENQMTVELVNNGAEVALMTKLTLRKTDGTRVLPAYYSDNYVSLLPGEHRTVAINYPAPASEGNLQVGLTGWNVRPVTIAVNGLAR